MFLFKDVTICMSLHNVKEIAEVNVDRQEMPEGNHLQNFNFFFFLLDSEFSLVNYSHYPWQSNTLKWSHIEKKMYISVEIFLAIFEIAFNFVRVIYDRLKETGIHTSNDL